MNPLTINFSNINYNIQIPTYSSGLLESLNIIKQQILPTNNGKNILSGISGCVKPGEILVVMGPSGSGKTSLLNILSGRVDSGITGTISINGDTNLKHFKKQIAYITQDETLLSTLTVKQNLEFTAKLRLDPKQITGRLDNVYNDLRLDQCLNTHIGGSNNIFGRQLRGISGGERKRTNIANELLTNPSLIILDEPTSGLDSNTAFSLMQTIKNIAASGKTVIMTLHQPSSQIYQMVDKLLLINNGKMLYYGLAKEAVTYFSKQGFKCPAFFNPPDYFMDILTDPKNKSQLENFNFCSDFNGNFNDTIYLINEQDYKPNWFRQLTILTNRHWKLKMSSFHIFPFIQVISVACILGIFWWQRKLTDENILIKNSALFLGLVFGVGFAPLMTSLTDYCGERFILSKERANGSYYFSAYFIAKRLAEIPLELISPLLYTIIVYWMVGFRADAWFLVHLAIMGLVAIISSNIGLTISALINNITVALNMTPVLVLTLVMVSGFYIPVKNLPSWIRWVSWLSYYKYGYDALVEIEYSSRSVKLVPDSHFFNNKTLTELQKMNATSANSTFIFDQLDINLDLGFNILVLVGFAIFFHTISYLIIKYKK